MTIAETVHAAAERLEAEGIDDARLEAEVLLAHALGIDRAHLLANLRDDAPGDAAARFEAMLVRRLRHEPLAYIVGHREFYGIEIACAPGALIPRPETEMLVEVALDEIRVRGSRPPHRRRRHGQRRHRGGDRPQRPGGAGRRRSRPPARRWRSPGATSSGTASASALTCERATCWRRPVCSTSSSRTCRT